jgi:hypothetical protein
MKREREMAYVSPNFKTKKALREAVNNGERVEIFSPGPFGCKTDGAEFVEGPHYPQPHRWYAKVTVKAGLVVEVGK